MVIKEISEPKPIGKIPEYKYGYENGLKTGIFNTLNYLTEKGYTKDSEFWSLLEQIEKENIGEVEHE